MLYLPLALPNFLLELVFLQARIGASSLIEKMILFLTLSKLVKPKEIPKKVLISLLTLSIGPLVIL